MTNNGMGVAKLSAKLEWCSGCSQYAEEGHECSGETGAQQMTGLLLDRVTHANAFVRGAGNGESI